MNFLLMLLIPFAISGVAFLVFKATITWKEFLLLLGLSVVLMGVGWQVAKWGSLRGTENLNGRITRKIADTQKCCHCRDVCDRRDKKGNCTSSHEDCDHIHDYYWDLETSVGKIGIEDCSGSDSPPDVWTNARVGEPATVEHGYTNYLLADKDSLYEHAPVARYDASIPDYPRVHTHYKADHVVGLSAPPSLAQEMREINADLGSTNQVDVTLILTGEQNPEYAQALEAKWLYGPKNSLNIVMGLQGDTIQWVRVITFSKVEMLKVRLRDQLQGLSINDPKVPQIIRTEVSGFKRTAMADFEYLASTASPEGWVLALLFVFEVLACAGLTYWMHVKDVFGDERFQVEANNYKYRKYRF
jgi:hypothetical protein